MRVMWCPFGFGRPTRPVPLCCNDDIFRVVRYFLSRRLPPADAILLVESGSRELIEGLLPGLRETWGTDVSIDIVTCYSKTPQGCHPDKTRIYRVTDYRGREGRRALYRKLARNGYAVMGIICSGEPVMAKWKWALAARIPAKVFVVNENGDYFWLDWGHLEPLRQFVLLRAGLAGTGAARTLARVICFPFTLLYLLLYAAMVHARRALRSFS